MLNRGIFTVSIDTELAWGTFDHGGHIRFKQVYKRYRALVRRILDLFEKYAVSATWALVGHLFLEKCDKSNGIAHPQIVRPQYRWFRGDWFACDPASDISHDNFWYGCDIVEMLKNSSIAQEIASHSFSHLIFSDPECSWAAAESDIAECVKVAGDSQVSLETFIFPRNGVGHLDILEKHGFKVYRGSGMPASARRKNFTARACSFLKDFLALTPAVVVPCRVGGLTAIDTSMLFRYSYGLSKFIPRGMRALRAKKGLNKAAITNRVFHLWTHPMNFGWNEQAMFKEFEGILSYAAELRDKGSILIMPLKEIAHAYRQ